MAGSVDKLLRNVLHENPKAFCVLCGGHSFSVFLGDVAKSLVTTVNLLGRGAKKPIPHLQHPRLVETFK
jgi:hypothetical protein